MKKIIALALFVVILCGQLFAVENQDELSVAIASQKEAAEFARFGGVAGIGLTVLGSVISLNGTTDSSKAGTVRQGADITVYLGSALVIIGAVTSFFAWMNQLAANDFQATVNTKFMERLNEK